MNLNKLFVTLALVLSGAAHAAKFEDVDSLKSISLTKLSTYWDSLSARQEDAGVTKVRITEKKPSEPWVNTVKQLLYKNGAEDASAKQIDLTEVDLDKEIDYLVSENYYIQEALKEAPALKAEFAKTLQEITGNKLVFVGHISGNEFSYHHITVVDVTRGEILSIYTGTSD